MMTVWETNELAVRTQDQAAMACKTHAYSASLNACVGQSTTNLP